MKNKTIPGRKYQIKLAKFGRKRFKVNTLQEEKFF